jgi:hypothetical protein
MISSVFNYSRFCSAASRFEKECISFVSNVISVGVDRWIQDVVAVFFAPCRKTVHGSSNYEVLDRGFSHLQRNEDQEIYATHRYIGSIPGCAFVMAGKEEDVCFDFAFENYQDLGAEPWIASRFLKVPRNPISDLENWTLIDVRDAQENDLIFYFDNADQFPHIHAKHFGIVSKVTKKSYDNPGIAIVSKWGRQNVYHHDIEKVPAVYGDYFLLMRSPQKEAAQQSLQARFYPRYRKFVYLSAALSLGFASWCTSYILNNFLCTFED